MRMVQGLEADRQEHRSPRMLRCEIVDPAGRRHSCLLKNVSPHGMGGSGCATIAKGDLVTIVVPHVSPLKARVCWSAGDRFGLSLDHAVDPERIRFTGTRNEAAPKFEVSAIHRPATDWRRPRL